MLNSIFKIVPVLYTFIPINLIPGKDSVFRLGVDSKYREIQNSMLQLCCFKNHVLPVFAGLINSLNSMPKPVVLTKIVFCKGKGAGF